MNTKQVCIELNITEKKLRIYEECGIVVPSRESNNYRNYSEEDLFKLRTVKMLRELGFSLKEIKKLIDNNNYGDSQLMRALYLQLKATETKIHELNSIKTTLMSGINVILGRDLELDEEHFLKYIDENLKKNIENRSVWLDKWGFDNKAIKFDNMVKQRKDDELGLFEGYDDILARVRMRILELRAKNVLDIGCGTGNLCGEIDTSVEVIGMDQSLEMLLQAKRKYGNMSFRLGNFLDKPFRKKCMDIVVTTYAFHSLNCTEKQMAIKNMLQYLKKNGKIIILDFMFENGSKRQECKNDLMNKNRKDLWEAIECKYYTDLEWLQDYVMSLECRIHTEHIINFTWMIEIEK